MLVFLTDDLLMAIFGNFINIYSLSKKTVLSQTSFYDGNLPPFDTIWWAARIQDQVLISTDSGLIARLEYRKKEDKAKDKKQK